MARVFVLHHEYEWCGNDEVKFIGVYDSRDDALAAIDRLRDQPGFQDWPKGFSIDCYEVGADHWVDGFIVDVPILIRSRSNSDAYQVAGSVWRPGDLYEITDISNPDDSEYRIGDVVRCSEGPVPGYGDKALVAIAIIGDSA